MAHSTERSINERLDHIEKTLRIINESLDHIKKTLRIIRAGMFLLISKENAIMATLDEDLALVTSNSTRLDSLQTYIQGLSDRITAGASLTPEQQTKIDAIFAGETANAAKIDTALNTGVPAPTPAPVPAA